MKQLVAGILCRVSTDWQFKKGHSIDAQERLCRSYCAERGYLVRDEFVFREGESGGSLDRTGLNAALAAARSGAVQVVVLVEVDRSSRSGVLAIGWLYTELEQCYCRLEFAGDQLELGTLYGDTMLALKAGVAAEERRKVSAKTRRAFEEMLEQNVPVRFGPPPFGWCWSDDAELLVDPTTGPVVVRIFTLAAQGHSALAIRRILNTKQVPSPAASRPSAYGYGNVDRPRSCSFTWATGTVCEIIRSTAAIGKRPLRQQRSVKVAPEEMMVRGQNGLSTKVHCVDRPSEEWVYTDCPRLVSDEVWAAANRTLDGRAGTLTRQAKHFCLLRGRILCGCCGRLMQCDFRGKQHLTYYRCGGRNLDPPCKAESIDGALVEQECWDRVYRVLADPERLLDQIRQEKEQGPDQALLNAREHAEQLLAALEREADSLVRIKACGGPVEVAAATRALADVERRHKELTEQLELLRQRLAQSVIREQEFASLEDHLFYLSLKVGLGCDDTEKRRWLDELDVVVTAIKPTDGGSCITDLTANISMSTLGEPSSARSARRNNSPRKHRDVFTFSLPLVAA